MMVVTMMMMMMTEQIGIRRLGQFITGCALNMFLI